MVAGCSECAVRPSQPDMRAQSAIVCAPQSGSRVGSGSTAAGFSHVAPCPAAMRTCYALTAMGSMRTATLSHRVLESDKKCIRWSCCPL